MTVLCYTKHRVKLELADRRLVFHQKQRKESLCQVALISLKNIGKIYVSEGVVAVGIRGVNLDFDRGEFVAITGKSGSGKSTLLNVISGMDSYEEGELFIEGEPTSHYAQADWEEYRKRYISFIFQDYNIVESFTVLQNVELALMHIDNPKERRQRALALIRRVGLESHIHHKGSHLSGGQKQRTVIARALAKDSPVLLADEPTGNLDSQTSKEIIALLREISREKLVIIVTHNFEQVAEYATRHVRVYDGSVEADERLAPPSPVQKSALTASERAGKDGFFATLRKGFTLGRVRFTAKPKLAFFLCLLMCISTIAATLVTALSGEMTEPISNTPIFSHRDGRLIVTPTGRGSLSAEELARLKETTGAVDSIRYDGLLDATNYLWFEDTRTGCPFIFDYDEGTKPDVGRAPQAPNEVMLSLPIGYRDLLGKESIRYRHLSDILNTYIGMDLEVVGVSYFYDNTKDSRMIFTREGFDLYSRLQMCRDHMNFYLQDDVMRQDDVSLYVVTDFPENSIGVFYANTYCTDRAAVPDTLRGLFSGGRDFYYEIVETPDTDQGTLEDPTLLDLSQCQYVYDISETLLETIQKFYYSCTLLVSPDLLMKITDSPTIGDGYTQTSFFYDNDQTAEKQIDLFRKAGYQAVMSDAVMKRDSSEVLLAGIAFLMTGFFWVASMLFIAFFLNLCSNKAMLASAGDIAIMRSMGISQRVIRVSVFVQTLLALLPAYLTAAAVFLAIYLIPSTNLIFRFLHFGEYFLIALGVFLISLRMAGHYVKRMFRVSVKKTLKGETVQ